MKVLILGSRGMLGSELEKQLASHDLVAVDRDQIDLTDELATKSFIREVKPELIFNCAAYNAVDKAESEPELPQRINADAVRYVAETAQELGATLVHYSTGFVFDGNNPNGYREEDLPNPQSVYARTKYEGEINAGRAEKHYIIRLNLLFGKQGTTADAKKSFPELILGLAKDQNEFKFVTDEISTPTYAVDLAKASIDLIEKQYPFGIYHLPNDGAASWYDFAAEVFKLSGIDAKLEKVTSDQFERPAKRPKNSVLLNTKYPKLRPWQEALQEFMTENNSK